MEWELLCQGGWPLQGNLTNGWRIPKAKIDIKSCQDKTALMCLLLQWRGFKQVEVNGSEGEEGRALLSSLETEHVLVWSLTTEFYNPHRPHPQ